MGSRGGEQRRKLLETRDQASRAGPCWTLLDPGRTLLDPAGPCWTLLDPAGPCWTLLDSESANMWGCRAQNLFPSL